MRYERGTWLSDENCKEMVGTTMHSLYEEVLTFLKCLQIPLIVIKRPRSCIELVRGV